MSNQYQGGIITKNPATPTGPFETGTAPGIWTLTQQAGYAKQGVWPTAGLSPNYIEDMFQTWLYTGNGTTNTITNGIDLSTKGGLVWMKSRSNATFHGLYDTVRGTGTGTSLYSNTTEAQGTNSANQNLTAFNTTGFTLGATSSTNVLNGSGNSYVSWTFREQAKFFDVVTYSGNSVSGRLISHSLNSAPGCIIVKCTNLAGTNWAVWHRSLATGYTLQLQGTNAAFNTKPQWFNSSTQGSSTTFEVGNDTDTNETGNTYVAYLFAHDAGGFGLTGTDNVISCGSFTTDGSGNATVSLGYEPQWVMLKASSAVEGWEMADNMRGFTTSAFRRLRANLSNAEDNSGESRITNTGFTRNGVGAGVTYIYIAIRRGPMKVPTDGTKVFAPQVYNGSASSPAFTGLSFPPDTVIQLYKAGGSATNGQVFGSKLQGAVYLQASNTSAEASEPDFVFYQNGFRAGSATTDYAAEMFRRAPSFHDVVCYTGTGTAGQTYSHNLGVVPELMIVKCRTNTDLWPVYSATLGPTKFIALNTGVVTTTAGAWNNTAPTASVFSVGANSYVNFDPSRTYVAYLFATCAGVSKVGSYTGTGAAQTINCGFTGGARFVLIVRTDSTGDWYVWDSARGIIPSNDPYLLLNSTAAEVTGTDYIDTAATGFEISSTAPAAINANGGTFIFLAIA